MPEDTVAAMTMTPWGTAGKLHERRLRPGPGVPREKVERNQRERLYGAMVAVATTVGYGRTRVSDLIDLAGVSRATFYRYFTDKRQCYMAALDEIIASALAASAGSLAREGSREERARQGIDVFTELLVSQPAGARLCLVEAHAVGPEAVEKVEKAMAGFERPLVEVFAQRPQHEGMPRELTSALVGSLRKMVHARLHRHTERELETVLPELLELGISYRPPPRPLRYVGSRAVAPEDAGAGRRTGDPAARIERATLATVARLGFGEASIAEIAAEAGVSLSTFYVHFDGKERAFDSALHSARMRLLAASEPAFRRSRGWAEGTRAGIENGLAFMESDPDFARVTTTEVYGAGSSALELLDRSIESIQPFVETGFELAPHVQPVAREAIPSAIHALLSERMRSPAPGRLRDLTPLATYLVLAPFLGAEEACRTANAG